MSLMSERGNQSGGSPGRGERHDQVCAPLRTVRNGVLGRAEADAALASMIAGKPCLPPLRDAGDRRRWGRAVALKSSNPVRRLTT